MPCESERTCRKFLLLRGICGTAFHSWMADALHATVSASPVTNSMEVEDGILLNSSAGIRFLLAGSIATTAFGFGMPFQKRVARTATIGARYPPAECPTMAVF